MKPKKSLLNTVNNAYCGFRLPAKNKRGVNAASRRNRQAPAAWLRNAVAEKLTRERAA